MDIFQLIGDLMHLFSLLMFLIKMLGSKNVIGMSYKTQEIYMVVFLTRYSSMFFINHWGSLYFNIMRIVFIAITAAIIRIMRFKRPYKLSYDKSLDAFPHYYLYAISLVLAIAFHYRPTFIGVFWSFSIWLYAFAIIPQLALIVKTKDIENVTGTAIMCIGFYRLFYLLHWIYNWESLVLTSFVAGILQTIFYADFIYYYCISNTNEMMIHLPI